MSDSSQDHPEFFKPAPEEEPQGLGFAGVNGSQTTEDAPAVEAAPSNRTTGALVALLGGVLFAVLYALAAWGYSAAAWMYGDSAEGTQAAVFIQDRTIAFLSTPVYWLTAIAFTLYFVILAILINKGHWRTFVLWGLVVAILTYATAIGAGLLTVRAWTLTLSEALDFMWHGIAFNPLVLVAVVLSREIPIWFGGWIAVKSRKLRDAPEVTE
ncbi:MAG: hypothetical protein RR877_03680 [Aurantimicrobium sp.]|uniref:hypothetical protein n=1 Tax=Aurantimicrobium sp. TaxID=1930784 RepID=UPI002FCC1780